MLSRAGCTPAASSDGALRAAFQLVAASRQRAARRGAVLLTSSASSAANAPRHNNVSAADPATRCAETNHAAAASIFSRCSSRRRRNKYSAVIERTREMLSLRARSSKRAMASASRRGRTRPADENSVAGVLATVSCGVSASSATSSSCCSGVAFCGSSISPPDTARANGPSKVVGSKFPLAAASDALIIRSAGKEIQTSAPPLEVAVGAAAPVRGDTAIKRNKPCTKAAPSARCCSTREGTKKAQPRPKDARAAAYRGPVELAPVTSATRSSGTPAGCAYAS